MGCWLKLYLAILLVRDYLLFSLLKWYQKSVQFRVLFCAKTITTPIQGQPIE